jgi:ABC-type multidrug transport system fused ATPase/permease subunit
VKIIQDLRSIFTKKEFIFFYIILISGVAVTVLDLLSILTIIPLFNIIFLNEEINFLNIKLSVVDINFKLLAIFFFSLLFIIKNFLIIFYNYKFINFFRNIKTKVTNKLFNTFLNQEYILFINNSSKNILQKIKDHVNHIDILLNSFIIIFVEILFLIGILVILFFSNYKIFLLTSSIFLIVGIIYLKLVKKKITHWSQSYHHSLSYVDNIILEGINGFKDIVFYNLKNNFSKNLDVNISNANHYLSRLNFLNYVQKYWLEIVGVIIISLALFYLVQTGLNVLKLLPVLSLFVISIFRLLMSSSRVFAAAQNIKFFYSSLESVRKYLEDLQIKKTIIHNKEFKFDESIKFDNVSFNYSVNSPSILKDISLTIYKNDFTVIVGKNGSGKSTFLNLVSGFLQPSEGKIIVDNQYDLFSNKESFIQNSSYVQQNIFLLDANIINNIVLTNDKLIDSIKLNKIISLLQIKDYFKNLPDQLNTEVGVNGIKLSGGQKQLISLARALYREADTLFFDEPTSALDKNIQNSFIKVLDSLKRKKTIFLVTHDVGIFSGHYDRIINIDSNKILIS